MQFLLNEQKDEDIDDADEIKKIKLIKQLKKTKKNVEERDKIIKQILEDFFDEYIDEEEEEEENSDSNNDDANVRDKDKEAKKQQENKKNKKSDKDSDKGSGKKSKKSKGNYTVTSDRNLGNESHFIFTVTKEIKQKQRVFRSKKRRMRRMLNKKRRIIKYIKGLKFLIGSHMAYLAKRKKFKMRIMGAFANVLIKQSLLKELSKRRVNIKKVEILSAKLRMIQKRKKMILKRYKQAREAEIKKKMYTDMIKAQSNEKNTTKRIDNLGRRF